MTDEPVAAWDAVAAAWGEHSEKLDAQLAAATTWMIERLDVQPGNTVLDLAAGAGSFGFRLAREVTGIRLITSDFAPAMVEVARQRAADLGIETDARVLDAMAVDLPDASVDRIACRMAYMLVPDPAAALREARRTLRPDGRLALAAWGRPERNMWIVAVGAAVVQQGLDTGGPADPFAPGGIFSLSDPARVEELLRDAGFAQVTAEEVESVTRRDSFDDYWRITAEVSGSIVGVIKAMTPEQLEATRESARQMLEPFRVGDGYEIPTVAVCAVAS